MKLLTDLIESFSSPSRWLYSTWFGLLIRYRRTIIGPLWIIATPVMFIVFLGALFVGLSSFSTSAFIPHMTIGFVCWTLFGGFLSRGATLFSRNKPLLLQGEVRHTDVILTDLSELVVHFLHQAILIVAVCLFYGTIQGAYALLSLVGLLIVIFNGFWFLVVASILGARYSDLGQLMISVSSIFFLATPIIWMPSAPAGELTGGRGTVLEIYMNYNPFYHFLEIVRAPLMNNPIQPLTFWVVGIVTVIGFLIAAFMYQRYRHLVVLWA